MEKIASLYITPDGFDNLFLQSDGEFLTGLHFVKTFPVKTFPETSQKITSITQILKETIHWLDIYFSGQQPDFTPAYKIENLTPFRQEVVEILTKIPFGKTISYGEIGLQIAEFWGVPKMSAQAVGNAVGWNPIGIIIPCHRVIGSNGKLIGYSGGIQNKKALLSLEGIM
ncbi:MAG: methylated-DNA--[protein]-cysteine S-methyltransferase [Bacteroidales bacterium]|nr:methylated-DNA--[protein]-cysteine S-methyltransferase [Bacteroidales bacterium]